MVAFINNVNEQRENFTCYIQQCVFYKRWGAAFDYVVDHYDKGVINEEEARKLFTLIVPQINTLSGESVCQPAVSERTQAVNLKTQNKTGCRSL